MRRIPPRGYRAWAPRGGWDVAECASAGFSVLNCLFTKWHLLSVSGGRNSFDADGVLQTLGRERPKIQNVKAGYSVFSEVGAQERKDGNKGRDSALGSASLIVGAVGLLAETFFAPYVSFAGIYGAWDLTLWMIENREKT